MKRARVATVGLLILFIPIFVSAADRVRITVIPLNYINVSKADASSMTRLLETGIVKTGSFAVIEQTQVGEILSAQEYSLQECTDEKCAVRIGKLLAAERIVLGDVSKIGTKLVMTAKIIDVETGMTLTADKVEAATIETLADQAELLAFMLAGLTYQRGAQQVIARSFGELFVQTSPDGAEVIVNGLSRGTSPLLVPKVPVGTVTVEGRKGTAYASRQIELTGAGLTEVNLSLSVKLGRLFVRSSEKAVNVWLDGKDLGPLGSGLFKDVPIGERRVELRGADSFWQGSVRVTEESTVTVDAAPAAVGVLEYDIPQPARAELTGNGIRLVLSGSGRSEYIAVGTYDVRVSGDPYTTFVGKVQVTRGQRSVFAPELEPSEQYQAAIAEQTRVLALGQARGILSWMEGLASRDIVQHVDAVQARSRIEAMQASPYRFDEEERRAQELLAVVERKVELGDLTEQRNRFEAESSLARSKARRLRTSGWLYLIGGLSAAGGTVAAVVHGNTTFINVCSYSAVILTVLSPISFHAACTLDRSVDEQIKDFDRRIEALSP